MLLIITCNGLFSGAPPPPSIGGGSSQKFSNIPRPKHPMKSLNWSKLSEVSAWIHCSFPIDVGSLYFKVLI